MGMTIVNLHVKVSDDEQEKQVKEFLEKISEQDFMENEIMEGMSDEIPEEFLEEMGIGMYSQEERIVEQNGYLSVLSGNVRFDNFEEVAEEISGLIGTPVMATAVFDSDMVIIEGFVSGQKILEEVCSLEERKQMDRAKFVEIFVPEGTDCSKEQVSDILDGKIDVFAEDILAELGSLMGMELVICE